MKDGTRLTQLYRWSHPNERIDTQYGNITCLEWFHKEKKRIEKADGRIAVIKHFNNKYSLWVNNVSDSRYERRTMPCHTN